MEIWLRIETALGTKLKEYELEKDEVMVFTPRVEEAQRHARMEMKTLIDDRGNKGSVLKGNHKGPKRGLLGGRDHMDKEEG